MKRKICMLILAMCLSVSVTACGNKESGKKDETSSEAAAKDEESTGRLVSPEKLDKYVKLGEYKGITLERSVDEVTDDQVEAQIQSALSAAAVESEDEKATVKEGDIVNINYVGKKDGVEFDGGSAEKYDLGIGTGSFIDGFEDGIIGMKKGQVKDLNLTFPEEYPSEELAGQDVVFTVTLNYIKSVPELTDEWVKENSDVDSVDAYKEQVRAGMQENNEAAAEIGLMNSAWAQVSEASEILEYPTADIEAAVQEYKDTLKSFAEQQGMTEDEFLEAQNITKEAFNEECTEYAKYKVKQNLIVQAIMDKEKLTLDDEQSKALLEEMVGNYGAASVEEMVSTYGQKTVDESVGLSRVCDFIIENATVESVVATEDSKEGIRVDDTEGNIEE